MGTHRAKTGLGFWEGDRMPYRKSYVAVGEFYHIYNRGNNFTNVFHHREDYVLFLRLVRRYLVERRVLEVAAYCLMPNHYHILGRTLSLGLSSAMQSLGLSFTKTLNNKYGRVGSLFQGRFKAVWVDRQRYFDALVIYIHRNPVQAGLARRAEEGEFSNYRDCLGLRRGTLVTGGHVDPLIHKADVEGSPGGPVDLGDVSLD